MDENPAPDQPFALDYASPLGRRRWSKAAIASLVIAVLSGPLGVVCAIAGANYGPAKIEELDALIGFAACFVISLLIAIFTIASLKRDGNDGPRGLILATIALIVTILWPILIVGWLLFVLGHSEL